MDIVVVEGCRWVVAAEGTVGSERRELDLAVVSGPTCDCQCR